MKKSELQKIIREEYVKLNEATTKSKVKDLIKQNKQKFKHYVDIQLVDREIILSLEVYVNKNTKEVKSDFDISNDVVPAEYKNWQRCTLTAQRYNQDDWDVSPFTSAPFKKYFGVSLKSEMTDEDLAKELNKIVKRIK